MEVTTLHAQIQTLSMFLTFILENVELIWCSKIIKEKSNLSHGLMTILALSQRLLIKTFISGVSRILIILNTFLRTKEQILIVLKRVWCLQINHLQVSLIPDSEFMLVELIKLFEKLFGAKLINSHKEALKDKQSLLTINNKSKNFLQVKNHDMNRLFNLQLLLL